MRPIQFFCGFMIVFLTALNLIAALTAITGGYNLWEHSTDDDKWRGLVMYFAWVFAYCWLETQGEAGSGAKISILNRGSK